jgi:hypothetical protein
LKITSDLVLKHGVDYDLLVNSSKNSLQMEDIRDRDELPIEKAVGIFGND